MEELFTEVEGIDDVTSVQSPYAPGGEFQIAQEGSAAGTIAYATVSLPEDIDFTRAAEISDEIEALVPEQDGLRVELGGYLFAEFEPPSSELFGLAFAIIILIVAFGSVLAMGLPIGTTLAGIGLGGAAVIIASHLIEVPDFAPFIGYMIGLGVGIDYALLIVTRYREQLTPATTSASRSASRWTPPAVRWCSPGRPSWSHCSACSSWASGSWAVSA